jgi:predicted acylesterase/phospholipase RssA
MYEVGVLESLLAHLPQEEIEYDVVTGVSIGSVNAATIGMYEKGREKEAFAKLKEYWSDSSTNGTFVEWPTWGPLSAFWKNSLFDNTPSHKSINSRLLNEMRRKVAFQSVNANDGKVYSFDETLDPSLQGESVVASTSIPVAFQPTTSIGDYQLVDGGTYSDLNL